MQNSSPMSNWRSRFHEIIFEADTPAGKLFDIVLIISIVLSVMAVMLDSVKEVNTSYGEFLYAAEWFFTILFSIEYFFGQSVLRNSFCQHTAAYRKLFENNGLISF